MEWIVINEGTWYYFADKWDMFKAWQAMGGSSMWRVDGITLRRYAA